MEQTHNLTALTTKPQKLLNELLGVAAVLGCRVMSLNLEDGDDRRPSRLNLKVQGTTQALEALAANLSPQEGLSLLVGPDKDEAWNQELALVKVAAEGEPDQVLQCAALFGASVMAEGDDWLVLKASGSSGQVEAFIKALKPYGILGLGRTGQVVMSPWSGKAGMKGPGTALSDLAFQTGEQTHLA